MGLGGVPGMWLDPKLTVPVLINLVRFAKLFWIDVLRQKIKTSKAMQTIF